MGRTRTLVGPMPSVDQWCWTLASTLAVFAAFLFQGTAYNVMFLSRILPMVEKGHWAPPFFILFNLAEGLALWSYLRARTADPGVVPQRWQEFVSSVGDSLQIAPARLEWQPGKATYCNQCGVPRPERAHHCRICGVCVLRMDHHCPWLSNCVGFKNHKYFILAVGYGLLASCIGLFTALPELALSFDVFVRQQEGLSLSKRWQLNPFDAYVMLISGMLSLVLTMLLSSMLAAHLELAAHNATSIEGHYDNMPNPFDQGSGLANMAQIFGDYGLDWFLPVAPRRPLTDGVAFERTDERILGPAGVEQLAWQQELPVERIWRIRYRVRSKVAGAQDDEAGFGGFRNWWGLGHMVTDKDPLINANGRFQGPQIRECDGGRYIISL